MQDDGPTNTPINLQDRLLESGVADTLRDAKIDGPVLHPIVIYQTYIDDISRINMTFDTEAWLDASEYPYNVHTDVMDKTIQTRDEARHFFEMISKMIRDQGIDSFRRVAEHAEFVDPSMIIGHHMTYLQKGGTDVVTPMASRMVIRNTSGIWRMISVTNAISNKQYPYEMPEPSDGLLPMANIAARNEQMRTRVAGTHSHLGLAEDETRAITIYRAFVEAFTQANMSGDFAMWCAMHTTRVRKHTPDEDMTVDTNDERRAIFDAITEEMSLSGADRFQRRAIFAEWIGPNRLRGKHVSDMTRNGRSVRPLIDSQFILERTHNAWKLVDVTNSAPLLHHSDGDPSFAATTPLALPEADTNASVIAFPSGRAARPSAQDIYQQVLNDTSQHINQPSFAGYAGTFRFPMSLHTETEDSVLTDPEELRPYFDTLVGIREASGADELARFAIHAAFVDDTLIAGHHIAHMLKDGQDIKAPVASRWLLRRIGEDWKIVSVANGLIDHEFPLRPLEGPDPARPDAAQLSHDRPDTAPGTEPGSRTDKGDTT